MATKVVYTLREDKQGLQKQLGCMNGIFQLFDRRYLLGLHRHGRNHKRLTPGQGENGEKEFKNSSEKAKEKNSKMVMTEKHRGSIESSRNSFSSSCSSTTFSSFECSKRVQTEWQLPSEVTTPKLNKKQPDWSVQSPDIRDVVRDSMTREIRVTKDKRVGPVMKHVDSPRPFIPQTSVQCDRKDRNHTKVQKPLLGMNEVKETPRLSCDERESQYSLRSTFKVKELPRLSLDSKQNSSRKSVNESRSEPGSNKRPSPGVVARLMGLESFADPVCEVQTIKTKPLFDEQLVSSSIWSKEDGECKQKYIYVFGEMEKRLSALEFKTSGKDLRALKQILEAMQMTKTGLENKSQKLKQPGSPTIRTSSPKRRELVNRAMKPAKMAIKSTMITGFNDVNRTSTKQVKDPTSTNKKGTGRTSRSLSPSNSSEYVTEERPVLRPRRLRSKNGVQKQCFQEPSSLSSRIKKQSNVKPTVLDLKTRHAKIKPLTPLQNNEQSCRSRNDGDITSPNRLEVTRNYQPKENHRVSENNFSERLMEEKPMVELAKLTVEQPSPVSVLDAFYVEDTPSPVKKKPSAFNDYEDLHDDEMGWNQVGVYNLVNTTNADQYSGFNHITVENRTRLIHQIEPLNSSSDDVTEAFPCKSTNADHEYISEILLASGFLKDPDSAIRIVQLHPTTSLIKPELFHLLEAECQKKNRISKSNDIIRRKMIFDSLNDILFHKLVVSGSSGMWTGKRCGRLVNGEKLLKELCSEIDYLKNCSERCLYDEDDKIKKLVSADVNKNSEDWDKCCYEVPGVVLDIERLIFKDLIDEVVNAEVASLQDRPRRHCRKLFSM